MYEAMRLASFTPGPGAGRAALAHHRGGAACARRQRPALGLEKQIGKSHPGYKADIVFLDLHHINWIPTNDPVNALVIPRMAAPCIPS